MKLKVTFVGVVLVVTGACGGGEDAEIDALIEEIARVQAQEVEEWERVAAIMREGPHESEVWRRALIHDWTERAEQARTGADRTLGQLRYAESQNAWNEVFLLGLAGMTPVEYLEDMKARAETALVRARERRARIEEQREQRAAGR